MGTDFQKRLGVFVALIVGLLLPMWASQFYCYAALSGFVVAGTVEFWVAVYNNASGFQDYLVYSILCLVWLIPTAAAIHCYDSAIGHIRLVELLVIQLVVGDSAQLIVGRSIGRHHVCAKLSPKKTLEGYVGGLVLTLAYGITVHSWSASNICVVYICGCVGDLYFSAIKRRLGIKDYSRALSSHGGFLDRVDSFIFAANALVWKAVLGSRWTSSSS
mmetsp:Transcript_55202/g.103487  ORF Transcript_55202/g.103487 Transcript_55202/m.103487 type:complete len:217 (+) Transcript_55202:3-653(+)